ncbi:MAG: hypothetical protein LBF88_13935, partial [Planctomycetaceae bacterium]|nr:hypothetical protein [Planctomycetaceae bacterium]
MNHPNDEIHPAEIFYDSPQIMPVFADYFLSARNNKTRSFIKIIKNFISVFCLFSIFKNDIIWSIKKRIVASATAFLELHSIRQHYFTCTRF